MKTFRVEEKVNNRWKPFAMFTADKQTTHHITARDVDSAIDYLYHRTTRLQQGIDAGTIRVIVVNTTQALALDGATPLL